MKAELYWITAAPNGRLAIMPRPRGGDWLADELASMRASGVDVVVSLLGDDEIVALDLQHEPTLCSEVGLTYLSYPITDRGVPTSAADFVEFANQLHHLLCKDRGVAIHCRMGIGRSSLLAACLLVKSGMSVNEVFKSISRARGIDVPDTNSQIEWVELIAGQLYDRTSAI